MSKLRRQTLKKGGKKMLKVFFKDLQDGQGVYNTSIYFDNVCEDDWIISPLAKEILKDIDKSEVLSPECIQ